MHDFNLLNRVSQKQRYHLVSKCPNLRNVLYRDGCAPDFFAILAYRGLGHSKNMCNFNLIHIMFFDEGLSHKSTDRGADSFRGNFARNEQISTECPSILGKHI